ncbi:MAG: hypothetical protein AN482_20215 [Anabaena sp. LE011-02]|nr:MAG: hypothetical protein AN482_20215 [Anabaena sp. LE011-02]
MIINYDTFIFVNCILREIVNAAPLLIIYKLDYYLRIKTYHTLVQSLMQQMKSIRNLIDKNLINNYY